MMFWLTWREREGRSDEHATTLCISFFDLPLSTNENILKYLFFFVDVNKRTHMDELIVRKTRTAQTANQHYRIG